MCRMRSIKETAELFREMDPATQITEKTLRIMISNGVIPVVKTGVKYLINVDLLLEMFGGTPANGAAKIVRNPNDFIIEK